MKRRMRVLSVVAVGAAVSVFILGSASVAAAEDDGFGARTELSVMGGIQALNENDTAFPDNVLAIPAVVTATYHLTPILAVEGEFTWMIPVDQEISLGAGVAQDAKTPDILAYQANLRASWPRASLTPYLAAGAGAITFLSNTDVARVPHLDESRTVFAINVGAGVTYGLSERWGLRADVREFVAFPPDDAVGLSDSGNADEIWMERGTVGLVYRF